jgi:HTH-type transcriptional regulator / antitoxin HigA
MSTLKVIRSKSQYREALDRFEELIEATKGSAGSDEREVLSILIERYEDEKYRMDPPSPHEAIKFRLEQAGMSRNDLAPYLGGRSKVSEYLSGKRELPLSAIRSLHGNLGIPLEVLIRKQAEKLPESLSGLDFKRFPLKEMNDRQAFHGFHGSLTQENAEAALLWLIEKTGGFREAIAAGFRTTASMRMSAALDPYALLGWSLHVLALARVTRVPNAFSPRFLTKSFIRGLVSLSALDDGPRHVRGYLSKAGIAFITVSHLRHTYLDGAVFRPSGQSPVVALTLRHDRLDNFWFVLLHEIGHLSLGHLTKGTTWIADNLDLPKDAAVIEEEADAFAAESLLPPDFDLHLRTEVSAAEIVQYAIEKGIGQAIVAGRIQHERKDFRTHAKLIGRGEVRKYFFSDQED